jgi:hypothetical protein
VEEENVIVDIRSEVDSDEPPSLADDALFLVPEMEESVAVIVPETQETVVDLLPHEAINPRPNRAEFAYGGFHPKPLSEGYTYSSYSKFASQLSDHDGLACFHCGRGMATERCPNCIYGVEFSCSYCDEE